MYIVAIDITPEARALLMGRLLEGARQAEVRRIEVIDLDIRRVRSFDWSTVVGCVIGSGCYENLEEVLEQVRMESPALPIGVVFPADVYASHGVALRRRLNIESIAEGDVAHLASLLLDCEARIQVSEGGNQQSGIIGFSQLKGGVGVTSLVAAFGSCWAQHGLSVAAVDLDDVNPSLSLWARVGPSQRATTSEFLRMGEVPAHRINEILNPIEGFEGRFVVVGQPESYNESFHFKSNVIDGIPSSSDFVQSLILGLKAEFDLVLIDMARSWGVASFATLPLCQHVLLVTDDDGMSVRGTLDGLQRLKRESDDPDEFNLARWSLILNGYTGRLLSPKDLASEIDRMRLFPEEATLYSIGFSGTGRQWGAPGKSLYDLADARTRQEIVKVAHSLVPFKVERDDGLGDRLMRKWQTLVQSS